MCARCVHTNKVLMRVLIAQFSYIQNYNHYRMSGFLTALTCTVGVTKFFHTKAPASWKNICFTQVFRCPKALRTRARSCCTVVFLVLIPHVCIVSVHTIVLTFNVCKCACALVLLLVSTVVTKNKDT